MVKLLGVVSFTAQSLHFRCWSHYNHLTWPATCNKCVINTAQMQTYPGIPGVRSMGLVSLYTHSLIIIGIGIDFDTVNTLVMYFPIFICNREDIEWYDQQRSHFPKNNPCSLWTDAILLPCAVTKLHKATTSWSNWHCTANHMHCIVVICYE